MSGGVRGQTHPFHIFEGYTTEKKQAHLFETPAECMPQKVCKQADSGKGTSRHKKSETGQQTHFRYSQKVRHRNSIEQTHPLETSGKGTSQEVRDWATNPF